MLTARPLVARPPAAVAARLPPLRPAVATPLRAVAAAATGEQAVAKTKYTRGSAHKVGRGVGVRAQCAVEREGARPRAPRRPRRGEHERRSVFRWPGHSRGRHTPHCHADASTGVCPVAVVGYRRENARWEGRAQLVERGGPPPPALSRPSHTLPHTPHTNTHPTSPLPTHPTHPPFKHTHTHSHSCAASWTPSGGAPTKRR